MPHILYNVPGRTVADMSNDTVLRLAQLPNIVGIKDATGGIERGSDLLQRAPKGFAVYSGDDASALALILLGAHGTISVTANVAPKLMHEMCASANIEKANGEFLASIMARPDQWTSHYNMGNYYLNRGELKQAVASYDKALKLEPRAVMAMVNSSLAYAGMGKNDKAAKSLQKAL